MSTITLARIYERQGHIDDALAIYTQLLQDKPQSRDIQKAIQRLQHRDTKKIAYFTKMHTKEQFAKFERWLVKPWS
jgi:cytochrome c-type biogenesis protein CcmH/NrfG